MRSTYIPSLNKEQGMSTEIEYNEMNSISYINMSLISFDCDGNHTSWGLKKELEEIEELEGLPCIFHSSYPISSDYSIILAS